MQAKLWCTTSRTKKVVVSLSLLALTVEVINSLCYHLAEVHVISDVNFVLFKMVVPVAVLVINVVVASKARRAAANAATNLGVQPHHQTTSSNSAVPTAMLIATSLIYFLLYSTSNILNLLTWLIWDAGFSRNAWFVGIISKSSFVADALVTLVFAYNFYIYLITGKQFRSELHKLFCSCLSSSSSSSVVAAAAAVADADDAKVARRGQY